MREPIKPEKGMDWQRQDQDMDGTERMCSSHSQLENRCCTVSRPPFSLEKDFWFETLEAVSMMELDKCTSPRIEVSIEDFSILLQ